MNRDVALFANAAVDAEVEIGLHSPRTPDDEAVSIFFGNERITLEFYDVESLERLRDLADEGARRLRTVIEANARKEVGSSVWTVTCSARGDDGRQVRIDRHCGDGPAPVVDVIDPAGLAGADPVAAG